MIPKKKKKKEKKTSQEVDHYLKSLKDHVLALGNWSDHFSPGLAQDGQNYDVVGLGELDINRFI